MRWDLKIEKKQAIVKRKKQVYFYPISGGRRIEKMKGEDTKNYFGVFDIRINTRYRGKKDRNIFVL